MKSSRWIILSALAALAVILAGALVMRSGAFAPAERPAVGGPFQLTDQSGRPVDEKILKGKWSLVFFGFTYCPEACPTTLTTLGQTLDQMGPAARRVQVVFVSVDPDRDTPAALKTYLASQSFPKGTIGLTGTRSRRSRGIVRTPKTVPSTAASIERQ